MRNDPVYRTLLTWEGTNNRCFDCLSVAGSQEPRNDRTGSLQEWIQTGSAALTAIMSILVICQLRQVARSVRGDTHGKLCDESFEILKIMAEQPDVYDYFYENKKLAPDSEARVRVLCVCECLANFLEHVSLQRENLPNNVWETWHAFICDSYLRSSVLRDHFDKFRGWCTSEILDIVAQCKPPSNLQ